MRLASVYSVVDTIAMFGGRESVALRRRQGRELAGCTGIMKGRNDGSKRGRRGTGPRGTRSTVSNVAGKWGRRTKAIVARHCRGSVPGCCGQTSNVPDRGQKALFSYDSATQPTSKAARGCSKMMRFAAKRVGFRWVLWRQMQCDCLPGNGQPPTEKGGNSRRVDGETKDQRQVEVVERICSIQAKSRVGILATSAWHGTLLGCSLVRQPETWKRTHPCNKRHAPRATCTAAAPPEPTCTDEAVLNLLLGYLQDTALRCAAP